MSSDQHTVHQHSKNSDLPRWRVAVGVFAVLAISVSVANPAQASNFGAYYADNADHYYARVNLTADGVTAANWGVTELDSKTDVSTFNDGTCKSDTDICFYDANYETDPWIKSSSWWATHNGLAHCNRATGLFGLGNRCKRWFVLFDVADMNDMTTWEVQELGCHEVGHTVGLKHTDSAESCMKTDRAGRISRTLSQHDIVHLNNRH